MLMDFFAQSFTSLLHIIEILEAFLWETVGFSAILVLGLYFTVRSGFIQLSVWSRLFSLVKSMSQSDGDHGVSPLKVFFANVGGAVGVGNVVGICMAVQIGGPGALLWVWIVALLGVVLKYAEVYLGMKYRKKTALGYDSGPMYYLPAAFSWKFLPKLAAIFLCIYGVEIYQFHVMVDSVSLSWSIPKPIVALSLLSVVMWAAMGGIRKVGEVASKIIPFFIAIYLFMSFWVLFMHITELPSVFVLIFKSAFTGHAAVGAFAGAGVLTCIQQGIAKGCYASDIGIGYNAMIHAESHETSAYRQASLTFLGVLIDLFGICSLSMLMILVTGLWKEPIDSSLLVQTALGKNFPYMEAFMPLMIVLLGYSTVIAFFSVGLKSAQFLSPRLGKPLFYLLGGFSLLLFSYFDSRFAMSVMALCGGSLLMINLLAFWRLRKEVHFSSDSAR